MWFDYETMLDYRVYVQIDLSYIQQYEVNNIINIFSTTSIK